MKAAACLLSSQIVQKRQWGSEKILDKIIAVSLSVTDLASLMDRTRNPDERRCGSLLLAKRYDYPNRSPPWELDPEHPSSFFNNPRRLGDIHGSLQTLGVSLLEFAIVCVGQEEYRKLDPPPIISLPLSLTPPVEVCETTGESAKMYLEPISLYSCAWLFCLVLDYALSPKEAAIRSNTKRLWNKYYKSQKPFVWWQFLSKRCTKCYANHEHQIPWCDRRALLLEAAVHGLIPDDDEMQSIKPCSEVPLEHACEWREQLRRRRAQDPELFKIVNSEIRKEDEEAARRAASEAKWRADKARCEQLEKERAEERRVENMQQELKTLEMERKLRAEKRRREEEDEEAEVARLERELRKKQLGDALEGRIPSSAVVAAAKFECVVCMEPKQLGIFNPCGHSCCADCYQKLPAKKCPTCRAAIVTHTLMFLP
jgi:hypothetical protein